LKSSPTPGINRIMAPLGIGLALSLVGDTTLYTVLPDPGIAAQAGLSLAVVGVVLGMNRLIRLLTNGVFGLLYDRKPRRRLMLAGMLAGGVSTLLYAVSQGPTLIIIARVLWGASWSAMWIGGNTIALDISTDDNRGQVNGRLQMWFYFAVAASALCGGLLTDWLGYRGGLFVAAGFSAAGFLLWYFFLIETRGSRVTPAARPLDNVPNQPYPWSFMLATSLPLFAMGFAFFGVINATNILWLAQFADGGFRVGGLALPLATLSGGLMAGRVLISTLGAPLIGGLSDTLHRRWGIMATALLLALMGLMLMSQTQPYLALTGAVVLSIMTGGISSLSSAIIGDRVVQEWHGRSLGLLYTARDLGATIGPPVALGLTPLIGLGTVYRLTAGLIAAAALAALYMTLREQRSQLIQTA
jgi:MFS family permease